MDPSTPRVSCGRVWATQWLSGHFWLVPGSSTHTRQLLLNIEASLRLSQRRDNRTKYGYI